MTTVSGVLGAYAIWKIKKHFSGENKKWSPSQVKLVPGGLPYFGHYFELSSDPIGFIKRCKAENGPVFILQINGKMIYVLTGPQIYEEMLKKRKLYNFSMGLESFLPMRRALKISYDHKYKGEQLERRDKNPVIYPIQHNFKADQISVFSERIQLGLNKVLEEQLKLEKGEKITMPLWDILSTSISQISCLAFAGRNIAYNQELVVEMANFTRKLQKIGMVLMTFPDWIANLIIKRYFSVESQLDLMMDLIVPEMQKMRSGEITNDSEPTYISMVLNLPKADGQRRTPKEAAFYFRYIVMASIHTTTQYTSFALHELACRPALVAALRTEIESLDKKTPETIGQIQLMDSFLREVLRFNSHVLGLHHKTTQDALLPTTGQIIPKDSLVLAAILDSHMNPEIMTETTNLESCTSPLNQFDAYRYMSAKQEDNDGNNMRSSTIGPELLTFGMFSHACPGRYFAVNEIKYILAQFIIRYNVTTQTGKRAKDFIFGGMSRFPPREPLVFEGR
ncbi:cytochrome P450 [Circinella umbellata]|nr:cytochrome P450 [Circinella umbellata]